tara:strand:+ start:239 stop:367 length:129 start_codon:yes stop_codon:yes gene_type:complete
MYGKYKSVFSIPTISLFCPKRINGTIKKKLILINCIKEYFET